MTNRLAESTLDLGLSMLDDHPQIEKRDETYVRHGAFVTPQT